MTQILAFLLTMFPAWTIFVTCFVFVLFGACIVYGQIFKGSKS